MSKQFMILSVLSGMIALSFSPAAAVDWEQSRERPLGQEQFHEQDRLNQQDMYGWELMTEEDRAEHRAKMRSMQTEQEREAYRLKHHEEMQQRAREKGITLPEMPAAGGRGMGPGGGGMGPGGGMGSGGGMGPGGGRGR